MTLKEQVLLLLEENKLLQQTVTEQAERISVLEDLLRKSKIHKDSSNSGKPPSSDYFSSKRNQSLRTKSEKKPGGQQGHKGKTLRMSDKPDKVVELKPSYCNDCSNNLESVEAEFVSKRQVIDIPIIMPFVTEYRNYKRLCPKCGNFQQSSYPEGVNTHIQYGSNVEAAIAYLSVYQYMPFKRLKECMQHFFGLEISQGSIANILERMSFKSQTVYNQIKAAIMTSTQIGSDETSAKVNGKNWWVWVWQTMFSTFISVSQSRGSKTIERLFPDGFSNAILNSDRWAAQLKTYAKGHQLCTSHLQRELKYLLELEKNDWAEQVNEVLNESLKLKNDCSEYNRGDPRTIQLERKFDILLKANIPKTKNKKTFAFQKSLIKHRYSIFTFLYYADVPPDNNASERAIRNVKVKQKISGQFKSGQDHFCVLRSVIDTCLKRGVDVMFALKAIARLNPAE
jgi:transposase